MKFAEIASPDNSGVEVPTMLPKISATLSVRNFGNNFKNLIFFLEFSPKLAFSISHFEQDGDAPGQKLFFNVMHID